MPGTSKGAANSKWVATLKRCSAEYKQEKGDKKTAPASKGRQASPSKTVKTTEVNTEIRKEKAAVKKLAATATKALAQNTAAPKGGQDPVEKSRKARLVKHQQESRNALGNNATAKALATVQNRRREVQQKAETHQSVAPPTLAVRKRYRTKAPEVFTAPAPK